MPIDSNKLFPDESLQNAFRWAHVLHPKKDVAFLVTLDAIKKYPPLKKHQNRNKYETKKPFKNRVSDYVLFQEAVYLASDSWEKDQESKKPSRRPHYKPNGNDLIVRYVKSLIWKNMTKRSYYMAVGIGAFLYTYKIAELLYLLDYLPFDNIRRIKSGVVKDIKKRFEQYNIILENPASLNTKEPVAAERVLIYKSLMKFAPWVVKHVEPPTAGKSILQTYFDSRSEISDMERIHALVDYECAGYQRLIQEFNSINSRSSVMLDEPEDKLRVPNFGDSIESNDNNRFDPEDLSEIDLILLRREFEKNQSYMETFRPNRIRLSLDDTDYILNPSDPDSNKFQILSDADYIEVYGIDDDRELLLEVIPLGQLNFDEFKELELPIEYGNKKELGLKIIPDNENDYLIKFQVHEAFEKKEEAKRRSWRNIFLTNKDAGFKPLMIRLAFTGLIISAVVTSMIIYFTKLDQSPERAIKNYDRNYEPFNGLSKSNIPDLPVNDAVERNLNRTTPKNPDDKNNRNSADNKTDYNIQNRNPAENPPEVKFDNAELAFLKPLDREDIRQSLSSKNIKMSEDLALLLEDSTRRGSDSPSIELISPQNEATLEIFPLLRWGNLENKEYRVEVLDRGLNVVAASDVLVQNSWRIDESLPADFYFWQVFVREKGAPDWETTKDRAYFKIVGDIEKSQIEKAKNLPDSNIITAILYARAGLLREAERELQKNSASPTARKMLKQVLGWRKK